MDKSEEKTKFICQNDKSVKQLVILREPKFPSVRERLNYCKLVAKVLRSRNHK